ncbi:MAG: DNA-binding protein [Chthonomonadaceae bacterium]|nr:DNA-binding protein [Chthonomonadaceae bacterium]
MATLAEALYAQPTERLRELVTARSIETKRLAMAPDKRQLVQLLTAELTRPQSLNAAALQCNARQLRLLQIMVSQETRSALAWKRVVEAVGGSGLEPALNHVMDGLTRLGLAFRIGPNVFIPDAVRHQIPQSLSDRCTLERLLNLYDAPALKRITENLGFRSGTKTNNIEAILIGLMGPNALAHLKSPLTEDEVRVLEYIIQVGGDALPSEVAAEVLGGKTDEFFRYDWQNRWKQGRERNAVDTLLARGLLFVLSPNYGYNLILVIPGDLLRAMTNTGGSVFWTEAAPAPKPLLPAPTQTKQHTTLIRDIVSLLGFLGTQEVARTNTGYIHKSGLKNAARTFSVSEDRYASFVYALCREAGLMAPYGEKQTYALTEKGDKWLQLGTREQQQTLFDAWRNGALWGEMFTEPLLKSNVYRSKELMVGIRQAALRIVANSATTEFMEIVSFTDALSFGSPLLLVETGHQGHMVASPLVFTRLLIGECLTWLGLVELAGTPAATSTEAAGLADAKGGKAASGRGETSKSSGPSFTGFRLTPLGATLLEAPNSAPLPEEPREDKFIVQANAEIFVPPYLAPAIYYNLLTLADVPTKGGTGNTVLLTRESIRRLLDRGATARNILSFLQAHARTGIPQNVEYLINEVGGKHGHIRVGKAHTYLQVDSPMLLQELQARRELKAHFVRTLSDTVAILKTEDPEVLLRDLRKAGYLPVNDDSALRNPLQIQKSEEVVASQPTPTPAAGRPAKAVPPATPDWERIARDDGKDWNSLAGQGNVMPPEAVQGKLQIAKLIRDAIETERTLQFAQTNMPEPHTLIPSHLFGNFVQGFSPVSEGHETHNVNLMTWARML